MQTYSIFQVFREAIRATDQNVFALLIYWAVVLPISAIGIWQETYSESQPLFSTLSGTFKLLVFMLLESASNALGATLAFSRIGYEIDKPLWKIEGDLQAIKRFFPLWFGLSLLVGIFSILSSVLSELTVDANLQFVLFITYITLAVFIIPLGASIMFFGRVTWHEFSESLKPIANQAAGVAFFVLFGIFAYLFLLGLLVSVPPSLAYVKLIVHIIGVYCDCLIFSGVWILYRLDRDSPKDDHDFYF